MPVRDALYYFQFVTVTKTTTTWQGEVLPVIPSVTFSSLNDCSVRVSGYMDWDSDRLTGYWSMFFQTPRSRRVSLHRFQPVGIVLAGQLRFQRVWRARKMAVRGHQERAGSRGRAALAGDRNDHSNHDGTTTQP